ncbi:MAG: SBBP repeat-containing protein [Promethearchaeota archaeon]
MIRHSKKQLLVLFVVTLTIFNFTLYVDNKITFTNSENAIKTSSNLLIQWNYTWGGSETDYGGGMVWDPAGYAYVSGTTRSFGANESDMCIIKYGSTGKEWNHTWGGSGIDYGNDVAVDSLGTAYVAGQMTSFGAPNGDISLVTFNFWGKSMNYSWGGSGNDYGNGVVLDSSGKAYVAGYTDSFGLSNISICLVKFNYTGFTGVEWNSTWGGDGVSVGLDVALDNSGNAYVAGHTTCFGAKEKDLCIVKFNTTGGVEWNNTWGRAGWDIGYGVAVDSNGNAYVTGSTENTETGDLDMCLVKFNTTGGIEWNYTWGGDEHDNGYGVDLDSSGNAYVVGETTSFGAIYIDVCIVKFNSTGVEWNYTWNGSGMDTGRDIALDSFGNIYVSLSTNSFTITNMDIGLFKFVFDTSEDGSQLPPDLLLYIIIGSIIGIAGISTITMLGIIRTRNKRVRALSTPQFFIKDVEVVRGGDWMVEAAQSVFQFKIKIKNTSHYVISNIQVIISAVPPGLELLSDKSYNFSDLSQNSFVSPTFKFKAKESCVGNTIESLVSFRDIEGHIQTINVEPFEIKYVCNLLVPKPISKQEYEQKTAKMSEKKIVLDCDMSPEEMERELSDILRVNNFYVLDKTPEPLGSEIRSLEGYAEGKYDKKDVALSVMMQRVAAQTTKLIVKAMSDREEKVVDLLKDINLKCDDLKTSNELILEYSQKIEEVLDEIDDLEEFLMRRLGSLWDRIKDVWKKYKSGEVGKLEFIKLGTEVIGKKFIKIFLGKIIK